MGAFRQRWDFMSMQFSRITRSLGDGRTNLPQGRLKSAIIRIIGDRLAEIKAYKKVPSYQVKFKDSNGNVFTRLMLNSIQNQVMFQSKILKLELFRWWVLN